MGVGRAGGHFGKEQWGSRATGRPGFRSRDPFDTSVLNRNPQSAANLRHLRGRHGIRFVGTAPTVKLGGSRVDFSPVGPPHSLKRRTKGRERTSGDDRPVRRTASKRPRKRAKAAGGRGPRDLDLDTRLPAAFARGGEERGESRNLPPNGPRPRRHFASEGTGVVKAAGDSAASCRIPPPGAGTSRDGRDVQTRGGE